MTHPVETWRLVDDVDRELTGAQQMALDLEALDQVHRGDPSVLRLYTWSVPTVSLGRFQSEADVDCDACTRLGVDVVHRPTGGRALLHGGDLTYSIATRPPFGTAKAITAVYVWLATGLIAGLADLGVHAEVARNDGPAGPACFAGQHGADLRVDARKLCGSAQLWRDGAVLQHGSILLRRLAFDETDVLVDAGDRAALRAATITLAELGAPSEARRVADALITGMSVALGCSFDTLRTLRFMAGH
jgi:lipoyl(octanoyl) transferase